MHTPFRAYQHTQTGTLMLWVLTPITLLTLLRAFATDFDLFEILILALLAFCLITFWSLTVIVDQQMVEVRFGPGLVRVVYPIDQIQNCSVVRNSPLAGWGIRLIAMGWLFNVSGLEAVEVEFKNGRRIRIGSDEPQELAKAIENAMIANHKH